MIKNNLPVIMAKNRIRISELSRMTGISANAISNLYNEKTTMISFDTIEKICKALDCTVGELFEVE